MPLNFHQLHIFHTVAQRGSFSAAAQALYMTQPAVTMQVQSLEEYFGVKLFMRSTKKIELTEAGRVLLPYAKRSIELIQDTDQAMTNFSQQQKGRLTLGASLTIGESILPRWLGPFGKEYPHIGISMKVMNTSHLIEELENNQLHFAIIEALIDHPELHIEPVMEDELVLVVPADHPLTKLDNLELANVLDHSFILREQGSGTRQVMEEKLMDNGYDPQQLKIVMELGSTGAIKSAVEAGLGISFLSVSSVKHEVALGLIKVLPINDVTFKRKFYSVYLKSTLLPLAAVTFLDFLRERDLSQWL